MTRGWCHHFCQEVPRGVNDVTDPEFEFPRLDMLGSGRGMSLDWFLVTVRALSVFLRLVAGFT